MKKPIIVCVDDEKIVLVSLKEQLRRNFQEDYNIEAIDNGELAIEILQTFIQQDIDIPVVIVDQVMPGMKGDELLTKIHQLLPRTRTVMLTGHANAEAVGNAVNHANLYRYIAKPWEESDLLLTTREAIHSYFQEKSLKEKNDTLEETQKNLVSLNKILEKKIETFNKFVPVQFIKLLTIDKDYIELGQCAELNLSVMFADIHSFTLISESFSLHQIFDFINEFLSDISPFINQHEGFIDKIIGDAVLALFLNADHSVRSAIEIQQEILRKKKNTSHAIALPYRVGIGINTGPVMVGTVGEPGRMETTAIGDTVNVASRVEGLTKFYKTPLIITENTVNNLTDVSSYHLRVIETAVVKGRQERIKIFEVLDALPEELMKKKLAILDLFNKSCHYYLSHRYLEAEKLFNKCLEICPEDEICRIYLNRINGSM